MTGYVLSPFAHPKPSFNIPVEPPSQSPSDEGRVSACWNKAYTPYLLGAMTQLLLQSTWKTDLQDIETTLGKMTDLYVLIGEATSCELLPLHSQDIDFTSSDGGGTAVVGTYVAGSGWAGQYVFLGGGYEYTLDLLLPVSGYPVGVNITIYDVIDFAQFRHRITLEINQPDGTTRGGIDYNVIPAGQSLSFGHGIVDNKELAGFVSVLLNWSTYPTNLTGHRFYVQSASLAYRS